VNRYFLFIDTEASGLPENWSLAYANDANWPHAVQIAWTICDENQAEVKRENHFIRNDGFEISKSALKIHGITTDYLQQHGEDRAEVLKLLAADIGRYHPLIVGHFIMLDYHILGAAFYRSGIENPMAKVPVFCTMQASGHIAYNNLGRQLHLSELYVLLFYRELKGQHNALVDAAATAQCFFELLNRGTIDSKMIEQQDAESQKWRDPTTPRGGCLLPALLLFITGLIVYIYWL